MNMNNNYACFLNGRLYGTGNLEYMNELFRDYVVYCEMYGKKEVMFRIFRYENKEELKEFVEVRE